MMSTGTSLKRLEHKDSVGPKKSWDYGKLSLGTVNSKEPLLTCDLCILRIPHFSPSSILR